MKYLLFFFVVFLFPLAHAEAKGRDMVCKVPGGSTIIYTDTTRRGCPDGMVEVTDVQVINELKKVKLIVCGEPSTTFVARYCGAGAFSDSYATLGYEIGKVYFEATLHIAEGQTEPGTWTSVGIITKSDSFVGLFLPPDDGHSLMAINTWHGPLKPDDLKDGDVIGVAMDMQRKKVTYYHNRRKLRARPVLPGTSAKLHKGKTYVADFSVSAPADRDDATDAWTVNFGTEPFRYKLPRGYKPYGGALSDGTKPSRPSRRSSRAR